MTSPSNVDQGQSRILQRKSSNIAFHTAANNDPAHPASLAGSKHDRHPAKEAFPHDSINAALCDTASELHNGINPASDPAALMTNGHAAQAVSIPGQVDIAEYRVPVQTADDSSSSGLAPDAAAEAVHAVAAGCDISTLADVTEQQCSTAHHEASSGAGPVSSPARLSLKLAMLDPTAVSLPAQLSPLGKKPPLCGPIELQASAADTAACSGLVGESAGSRLSEELPRSSLSPAGGHPSASPHCHAAPPSTPQAQPKPLRVRAVTFNMNFKTPTQLPEQLLGRAGCPEGLTKYDIVVVGTQESGPLQEWDKLVAKALGPKYIKYASESLMAISILVYVRLKLQEHLSHMATSYVATGVGNVLGNKGGVGVALTYMKHTRLLFVNAHFAAHDHKVAQRQADYLRIKAGLFNSKEEPGIEWAPFVMDRDAVAAASQSLGSKTDPSFPRSPPLLSRLLRDETGSMSSSEGSFSTSTPTPSFTQRLHQWAQPSFRDVADDYHVTFWLGDLNYRVEAGGNRRVIDDLLKAEMLEVLRANDQLKRERKLGKVFLGYKEGELTFPPTFKFDPGTDVYDSSAKSRIPSWCDRVLWRCNSDAYDTVELLQYTHVPQLKVSDHRPVVATFLVQAQPIPEGIPKEKGVTGMLHRLQRLCTIQ